MRDGIPLRSSLLWLIWGAIVLIIGTQSHFYYSALRLSYPEIRSSWLDSFRFPLVECTFWAAVTPALLWLSRRFPIFTSAWRKNVVCLLAADLAVDLLHVAYRAPLTRLVYPDMKPTPLPRLMRFYLLGNSLTDAWIFWTIIVLSQLLAYYVRYLDREKELARAQLQAVTAQLQPHFFFNVLNSVSALMREDVEAADDMITRLSDLMRSTLKSSSPQEIPLREELNIVATYMEIERTRFQDRLTFVVEAEPDALDGAVPTLILLPLVENSVRYAIAPRRQPGTVQIHATRDNGHLVLCVRDDGPGMASGLAEGIGLGSTRTRLERYYSGLASFSYHNSPEGGFEVEVRLPFVAVAQEPHGYSHAHRG
jgi:two-component system, LytTR family, sensor kinase